MEIHSRIERTLTTIDHARLSRMAWRSERDAYDVVQSMLDESEVVPSASVPPSVVTMYTQVLLKGAGTHPAKVTLCYPDDAEPSRGFISVLSPLGASLLGLKVGDRATWHSPTGDECSAEILEVLFQPEASGDYTT